MNANITSNARFNQDRWEGVREFFVSTYEDNYAFRVYLAQKAFNINEIVYRQTLDRLIRENNTDKAAELIELRRRTFLSQSGLLLHAGKLVENYFQKGEFERILIVDELALTGRDFSSMIYTLEDAVCFAWEQKQGRKLRSDEYRKLRKALFSAVDFRAYMMDHRGLLVEYALANKVYAQGKRSFNRCFQFAKYVTEMVSDYEDVEPTAFYPSFFIRQNAYNELRHELLSSEQWLELIVPTPDGKEFSVFKWKSVMAEGFYAAICCHKAGEDSMAMTPYVLFDCIEEIQQQTLFDRIAANLHNLGAEALADVFTQRGNHINRKIQLQLTASILSLVFFYSQLIDSGLLDETASPKNDLDKITQFFGLIAELGEDFEQLCRPGEQAKSVRASLVNAVLQPSPFVIYDKGDVDSALIEEATAYCSQFHLELECREQERNQLRREQDVNYTPWSESILEDEGSLPKYLGKKISHCPETDAKLAALLAYAQRGFVGIRVCDLPDCNEYSNAGEATASLAYYAIREKLPSLKLLEAWCAEKGLAQVIWAARFGRYLNETLAAQGGTDWETLLREMVRSIYRCRLRLRDWPNAEDRPGIENAPPENEVRSFIQAVREGRA